MKYLVTGDEMREYDNNTIEHIGIPALVLMERAALAVRDEIIAIGKGKYVLIAAGTGNNGGDGLALARLLAEAGYKVEVCIIGKVERATESFQKQLAILKKYPVELISCASISDKRKDFYDIIVDAVFGVGLSREITGEYAWLIEELNSLEGIKIAVDIPSGISANDGKLLGCAFRADRTVTFAFGKLGMYLYPGADYAGQVKVADIGITEQAFQDSMPQMVTYDEGPDRLLPKRKADGNKGTFGKVLVIAGFENMVGAAILCSRAALEMGAGMVKVICPLENRAILQASLPEVLYATVSDLENSLKWADAVVIGPGLGKSDEARRTLEYVLGNATLPLVLDADALNLISASEELKEMLSAYKKVKILTPHAGELARLAGFSIQATKESFIEVAKKLAMEYHSIMVCKDARTLIVREKGWSYLNQSGNNGMATAGSGDVLAGIISSLLAQDENAFEAACKGVYLHGLAGDSARDLHIEYGVTASRIIENIRNF